MKINNPVITTDQFMDLLTKPCCGNCFSQKGLMLSTYGYHLSPIHNLEDWFESLLYLEKISIYNKLKLIKH